MLKNELLLSLSLLNDLFGYDVVIDGDAMLGEVWLGEHFLYFVELA